MDFVANHLNMALNFDFYEIKFSSLIACIVMVKMNLSENICDLGWLSFQGRSIYRNGFLPSCTTFTITHSYHAQSFSWIHLSGFWRALKC